MIHLPHWFDEAIHEVAEETGTIFEKLSGLVLNFDGEKLPPWVDASLHAVDSSGIRSIETGLYLALDGHPLGAAARAAALAAAGVVEDQLEIAAPEAIAAATATLAAREAAAAPAETVTARSRSRSAETPTPPPPPATPALAPEAQQKG